MNVVDPILYRCRQTPPTAAISAPGTPLNLISYARLERFIHNIGNRALSPDHAPRGAFLAPPPRGRASTAAPAGSV
jgi:hypothetical protein